METPEDSPHLEWWEEAERKDEKEEGEMLEQQEALLESFATTCKEERTRAAAAPAVRTESSPRGHRRVPVCPQFLVRRFAKVACIWKDVAERSKAFEDDASCPANGEGAAAAPIVISSDEEE
jgi:hypothetical protein